MKVERTSARGGISATTAIWWLVTLVAAAPLPARQGESPRATGEPVPLPPTSIVEQAPNWEQELDAAVDLLIDGDYATAIEKLDGLLKRVEVPEEVAARARVLRGKAEGKLATAGNPEGPRPVVRIPAPDGAPPPRAEASFKVRHARIGEGFAAGSSGKLLISSAGVVFTPHGRSRQGWSVAWRDLAEARKDTGMWDSPYPLVIVEHGGRERFVALIDGSGRHQPGDPILTAIAEGRRRRAKAEKAAAKAAEPASGSQETRHDETPEPPLVEQ